MKTMLAGPLAAGLTLSTAAAEAGPACQHHVLAIRADLSVSRTSFCCYNVYFSAPMLPYARRYGPSAFIKFSSAIIANRSNDASIKRAYSLLPSSCALTLEVLTSCTWRGRHGTAPSSKCGQGRCGVGCNGCKVKSTCGPLQHKPACRAACATIFPLM